MRNAHDILREDTIKETLAKGVKAITAANPKSLMAGFYKQNYGSWGGGGGPQTQVLHKTEGYKVFKNTMKQNYWLWITHQNIKGSN
jgi:type IV secretory pathway VirB6-like protein